MVTSGSLELDDLKGMSHPQGFLLYTSAKVEKPGMYLSGPISVDQVLMNSGYLLIPELDRPGVRSWMERTVDNRKESIIYHPLAPKDPQETRRLDMQTRINFVGGGQSDAVYDVAREMLEAGHRILVPPLNRLMDRLYHFKPGDKYLSEVVELE